MKKAQRRRTSTWERAPGKQALFMSSHVTRRNDRDNSYTCTVARPRELVVPTLAVQAAVKTDKLCSLHGYDRMGEEAGPLVLFFRHYY